MDELVEHFKTAFDDEEVTILLQVAKKAYPKAIFTIEDIKEIAYQSWLYSTQASKTIPDSKKDFHEWWNDYILKNGLQIKDNQL